MRRLAMAACVVLCLGAPVAAAGLDAQAVNDASFEAGKVVGRKDALLVKAEVLLSRAHFSPGEIDGKPGANYAKALAAFAAERGLPATNELTDDVWRELTAGSTDPALTEYTITDADVRGPFAKRIPRRMEDMKHLPALSYVSPRELLAEKFQISEALLAALNPGKKFDRAGETIVVTDAARQKPGKAARIEVDKTDQTLKAFGPDGRLLAFYPITAGSTEKPAPSGQLKVRTINKNPTYRYNPEYAFKGVHSKHPFTIRPGPNNPVGLVWIGLTGQGYGLHGTPEPGKISKSESHGCIRMTNWDALELADAVAKGVPVDFVGDEQERKIAHAEARDQTRGAKHKRRR